jgi:hypothetical protein
MLDVSAIHRLRGEGIEPRLRGSWESAAQAFAAPMKRMKLHVLLVDGIASKTLGSIGNR